MQWTAMICIDPFDFISRLLYIRLFIFLALSHFTADISPSTKAKLTGLKTTFHTLLYRSLISIICGSLVRLQMFMSYTPFLPTEDFTVSRNILYILRDGSNTIDNEKWNVVDRGRCRESTKLQEYLPVDKPAWVSYGNRSGWSTRPNNTGVQLQDDGVLQRYIVISLSSFFLWGEIRCCWQAF